MNFRKSLLGYRNFWPETKIREFIKSSRKFDSSSESPDQAESLLIFETSKQHTWLVSTEKRLYFILDDIRKPSAKVLRIDSKESLREKGDFINFIKTRDYSERTGVVEIGERRRGWLYSKRLFQDKSVEVAISEFLGHN